MLKAYKYRIYPTYDQKVIIQKHTDAFRLIYNLSLETKINAYSSTGKTLTSFDLINQLPELKKEFFWLNEVCAQSLQLSIKNMDNAFKMFFKRNSDFPKFKSKNSQRNNCQFPQDTKVYFNENKLRLPKIGVLKAVLHRKFEGKIKTSTITKTPSGKYYVSILIDNDVNLPIPLVINKNECLGIDLGLKSFAVTSDGDVFDNPKYLKKSINKLKIIQKRASKKKIGSKNRIKSNLKISLLHEKITNQRKDFLHKLSSKLISDNQTIFVEDLAIENMRSNHNLAQSISDVGWGNFILMLKYKSKWYGKNILQIGRFEPSSKTCSSCGKINKELSLNNRDWTCVGCGVIHDRDVNAAINIKNFGLKNSGTECAGELVELSASVETKKQEAFCNSLTSN